MVAEKITTGKGAETSEKQSSPMKKTFDCAYFHWAVMNGDIDRVRNNVVYGHYDVNEPNNQGVTGLHVAAKYGQVEVGKFLIEKCQANVLLKDKSGRTALDYLADFKKENPDKDVSQLENSLKTRMKETTNEELAFLLAPGLGDEVASQNFFNALEKKKEALSTLKDAGTPVSIQYQRGDGSWGEVEFAANEQKAIKDPTSSQR